MNNDFERLFSSDLLNKPYQNNSEYLNTQLATVKMLLSDYINAKESGKIQEKKEEAREKYFKACLMARSRVLCDKKNFFAGEYLKKVYKLELLDWFCVLVGVLIKLDEKYEKELYKINDTQAITYESVLKLYYFTDNILEIEDYSNIYANLLQKMNSLCFSGKNLKIDPKIFENIVNNARSERSIPGVAVRMPEKDAPALVIRENLAQKINLYIKDVAKPSAATYFYIKGMEGIGKKTLAERVCNIMGKSLISLDFNDLPVSESEVFSIINSAYREALFEKGYICIKNLEKVISEKIWKDSHIDYIFKKASNFSPVVFILNNIQENEADILRPHLEKYNFIDIFLDELSADENFAIWQSSLEKSKLGEKADLDVREIANKFNFTPKQIVNTVTQAKNQASWNADEKTFSVNDKFLCEMAYKQITGKLTDKATLIKKKHSWDELVMKKDQKEIIRRACDQIKYKHIVYDKWGMGKRVLYGRGLSMLFTGPPGTGKTMAAQVVANELELEIYKVDLSKVISKYIGESEKNLGEVFDSAKRSNVILLFDETDALFGKRTEVKDSHDKNANVETSYLLQKMEEYDGITIMTTNFIENIDKAFFRRINYVIHFNFPDIASRKEIWIKMFPKETPLDQDIDFDFLAKKFEIAGGSIKNAVITSTFMAASESSKVGMKHIIKALEYEIKKQGKIVSKSDFGEYGYLLRS